MRMPTRLHVRQADEAVRIGPPPVQDSYLNVDALLAAAKLAGADAVHPGYGFLSENAAFAEACAQAGLVFIGPPAAAIAAMGNKARAKALMQAAGVPCVPGYQGPDQSDDKMHGGRPAHRLSADGQGRGRRRRARHAPRAPPPTISPTRWRGRVPRRQARSARTS